MVLSAFNPRTQEAEAGGSLWVQGQPGLQSSLEDNQWCYTERFCLEKPKKKWDLTEVMKFYCTPAHK